MTDTTFDVDAFATRHHLGDVSEKYRRGIAHQRALDPGLPDVIQSALNDVAPDFGKIIVEYVFADVYARPGLDLKSRVLATLAAVTALNQVFAIKEYVRFALNVGYSRTEVIEVLMQMSVYAGMGPAMDALMAAKEVFADLDRATDKADAAAQDA